MPIPDSWAQVPVLHKWQPVDPPKRGVTHACANCCSTYPVGPIYDPCPAGWGGRPVTDDTGAEVGLVTRAWVDQGGGIEDQERGS